MKIFSFAREGLELKPIEVEVSLMPGLPRFEVTGLADSGIKESLSRVRAALKNSDYDLPIRQRVVFNLKPAYNRKKSEGLDFAFAVGYLLESKQLKLDELEGKNLFVYGELGLDGDVSTSNEISLLDRLPANSQLLTGEGIEPVNVSHFRARSLRALNEVEEFDGDEVSGRVDRPELSSICFDSKSAEALAIVATGEHSCLLAGPAGTGKSTWALQLHSLLRDLNSDEQKEIRRIARITGDDLSWRPFVSPHHTIPGLSLIGGGRPPFPGDITRAHKGILFLDEFLEFQPAAKEALREPIETGSITVSRLGSIQKFPAEFLLVGATNLCPCGDWVPDKRSECQRSLSRCKLYLNKLSGPLLDRFDVLVLTNDWTGAKTHSVPEIFERVERAQKFGREKRGQVVMNARLDDAEIFKTVDNVTRELFRSQSTSMRREKALFRVARTIADLQGSEAIRLEHLRRALDITGKNFNSLKRGML